MNRTHQGEFTTCFFISSDAESSETGILYLAEYWFNNNFSFSVDFFGGF